MKVALVAGASGFIGSNLSRLLLDKDYQVIGVDDHSTSDGTNLKQLKETSQFSFVNASVTSNYEEFAPKPVDVIFHLASPASPPKYQALGLETIHANTLGTENLISLALRDSARLVFASTSEIYGDPLVSPQPEDYWGNVNPIGPRSVYDESKRMGETLISHFSTRDKLDGAIVRIFNTYGPGMDPHDGRVVSTFIRQALAGEPFTVYGDGSQTRSFCYVDDLIDGLLKMAESKESGPINLGNPIEHDLISLGNLIAEVVDVEPRFEFKSLPQDDPRQRKPDISRANQLLNWNPTVRLEEGIAKTAEWIKMKVSRIEK
jgi:dTDP-glucose 4,6-dehydratase